MNETVDRVFVGVQSARGCPYAAIDGEGRSVGAGWLAKGSVVRELRGLIDRLKADGQQPIVGIDAPRYLLPLKRQCRWQRRGWTKCAEGEALVGRHCELVISAHRLASPQWTPVTGSAAIPEWIALGIQLFQALAGVTDVHEVFPSASYTMFSRAPEPVPLSVDLTAFAQGQKDMLDAYVAALTVREVVFGRGEEVGGGDGLGRIALPRRIEEGKRLRVIDWPVLS